MRKSYERAALDESHVLTDPMAQFQRWFDDAVHAKVDVVTADAVTDEKKGSYYPAILTLAAKDMLIDGKRIPLTPGMNITAEIKTGQRRIIEFLLSPVQRAGSESLRER